MVLLLLFKSRTEIKPNFIILLNYENTLMKTISFLMIFIITPLNLYFHSYLKHILSSALYFLRLNTLSAYH